MGKSLQIWKLFANFAPVDRKILLYKNYFRDFYQKLEDGAQRKMDYVLDMLKTQKTPQSEIEKAIKLKNEYYASKRES